MTISHSLSLSLNIAILAIDRIKRNSCCMMKYMYDENCALILRTCQILS